MSIDIGVLAARLERSPPNTLVDPNRLTRGQLGRFGHIYSARSENVKLRSRGECEATSALGGRRRAQQLALLAAETRRKMTSLILAERVSRMHRKTCKERKSK